MEDIQRKLVFSILGFFDDEKRFAGFEDGLLAKLENALNILEDVYQLFRSNDDDVKKFGISVKLFDIFIGNTNQSYPPAGNGHPIPPSNPINFAAPMQIPYPHPYPNNYEPCTPNLFPHHLYPFPQTIFPNASNVLTYPHPFLNADCDPSSAIVGYSYNNAPYHQHAHM